MVATATRQLDQLKDVASGIASGIASDIGHALPSVVRDLPSAVRDLPGAVRELPEVAISHTPFAKKKPGKARRFSKPVAVILVVALVAGLVKFWPRSPSSSTAYSGDGDSDPVSR